MTGTGASITATNQIDVPTGGTLYFEGAVPRGNISVNLAEGATLKFYGTDAGEHSNNNALIYGTSQSFSLTGDGNLVKTGNGNLFMSNNGDYSSAGSILLSEKSTIDVQEGGLVNGGWNANMWKKGDSVNKATLNIAAKGTVDLWDGHLYVGGITGDVTESSAGLIKAKNSGKIYIGEGITANTAYTYSGKVDLGSDDTLTKSGNTTQKFAGTFSNTGSTILSSGVLEFSGTASISNLTVNGGELKVSGGTTTVQNSVSFDNSTKKLNVTGGTAEFTNALNLTGDVTIPDGATIKLTGTSSSLTSANKINIQSGGTLYFYNAVPHQGSTLSINLEEGSTLKFYEDNKDGHTNNNSLVVSNVNNGLVLTGDGTLIKTGAGNLYVSNVGSIQNGPTSFLLSEKATIDIQEGLFANGGNYVQNVWKRDSSVNKATLNVASKSTVDLWDGYLYVGGITGNISTDESGNVLAGNIKATHGGGTITIGEGITDSTKTYVYNGNVNLSNTLTKSGKTSQAFAGKFINNGTTTLNDGVLEFSGTADLYGLNLNGGELKVTGGQTTFHNERSFDSGNSLISVSDGGQLILDPGNEKVNAQTYDDALKITGTVSVKSGYFRVLNVSKNTTVELIGGTLQNNGNEPLYKVESTVDGNVVVTSDSRLMAGWGSDGRLFVNGVVSGSGKVIIRDDSGVVYLNNSNTYSGGTQIGDRYNANAHLALGAENALGTGHVYFGSNNSTLDLNGYSQTIAGLGVDVSTTEVQYKGYINNTGATTTLTLNTPAGKTYNYNTNLASNISLVKTGLGTQQFNLTNDTTFSNNIIVAQGRLDLKEYYKGTIEVNAGGTLSPGNSIGKLYLTGDFNLNNAGTLLMEIGGADLNSNDYLQVTGDLNLTDGSIIYLDLSDTSTLAMGETFTVNLTADNSSDFASDFISKYVRSYYFTDLQYSQLSDGSYAITGRIDPNAVPEPSTWTLLLLGSVGLWWIRRRNERQ